MSKAGVHIKLDRDDLEGALQDLERAEDSVDTSYLKKTLKRKASPILSSMVAKSPSNRLREVIGASVAKGNIGGDRADVRLGVIKNDVDLFEDISSYALASILEYGTTERFRTTLGVATSGGYTGRVTTKDKWLRNSYDTNKEKTINEFEQTVADHIEKALN